MYVSYPVCGHHYQSVKETGRFSQRGGEGNFDIELLPVETEDEVGVVTGAFNSMVVSIGRYIERSERAWRQSVP